MSWDDDVVLIWNPALVWVGVVLPKCCILPSSHLLPPAGHSSPSSPSSPHLVPIRSSGGPPPPASDAQGPGPSGDSGWPLLHLQLPTTTCIPSCTQVPTQVVCLHDNMDPRLLLRLASIFISAFSCSESGLDCCYSHDHWDSITPFTLQFMIAANRIGAGLCSGAMPTLSSHSLFSHASSLFFCPLPFVISFPPGDCGALEPHWSLSILPGPRGR